MRVAGREEIEENTTTEMVVAQLLQVSCHLLQVGGEKGRAGDRERENDYNYM